MPGERTRLGTASVSLRGDGRYRYYQVYSGIGREAGVLMFATCADARIIANV